MRHLIVLVCLLYFYSSCSNDDDSSAQDNKELVIQNLQGEWTSDQVVEFNIPIPNPNFEVVYQTEVFTFNGQSNQLVNTSYADRELTIPLLRYVSNGPFEILRESLLFEDTWEADFANTSQSVELLTDDAAFIELFGFQDCGVTTPNVIYPINEGCSIFPSVDDCIERDIIQITDGNLRFGTRTADICTQRVTTLQTVVYTQN
ncbi:hypothetical protein J8281_00255 [Aquimarina sp. U1-2]|uniref:hypothetical protein n=1 Tax=Aquimarina sp. U1-2 TaxID=2823141 RepID=UPI001AECDD31|nr:hypothetical protein [Aquimarina sp. U1-2]MBP2830600.1 hypothetical protein [Aquimarina sp. U1-2]